MPTEHKLKQLNLFDLQEQKGPPHKGMRSFYELAFATRLYFFLVGGEASAFSINE